MGDKVVFVTLLRVTKLLVRELYLTMLCARRVVCVCVWQCCVRVDIVRARVCVCVWTI